MEPLLVLFLLLFKFVQVNARCITGNLVDECWRCDRNWHLSRQRLAECGAGFGKNARGGQGGRTYVVTDPRDGVHADDPIPGTLRHAVNQTEPLWIIFAYSMSIKLQSELKINSYTTIDGRGANVAISSQGPCLVLRGVSHVIIHGINISHCTRGDGITILDSNNVWVDHCSLSRCSDGLIDATRSSTNLTFSNNHFSDHVKVMLLGHSNSYSQDTGMQATVAYNHFGPGCIERMPRCRFGNFHVVNNDYSAWGLYAIGGSANPTINAEGNRFLASSRKEVTMRIATQETAWKNWNWRSANNIFINGSFFVASGNTSAAAYERARSLEALPAAFVGTITASAGALACTVGFPC